MCAVSATSHARKNYLFQPHQLHHDSLEQIHQTHTMWISNHLQESRSLQLRRVHWNLLGLRYQQHEGLSRQRHLQQAKQLQQKLWRHTHEKQLIHFHCLHHARLDWIQQLLPANGKMGRTFNHSTWITLHTIRSKVSDPHFYRVINDTCTSLFDVMPYITQTIKPPSKSHKYSENNYYYFDLDHLMYNIATVLWTVFNAGNWVLPCHPTTAKLLTWS